MLAFLVSLLVGTAQADTITAEGLVQATPSGQVAPGIGVRAESGGLFLGVEGRAYLGEAWMGRVTAGVDLFSSDRFDLTLGGFGGTAGAFLGPGLAVTDIDPTYGLELGIGGRVGPMHLRYRRADGLRGPLTQHLSENEVRLGYELFDTVELFAQYVRFNPGDESRVRGLGLGTAVRF